MVDRLGKVVKNGDCVRYWHKVGGKPVPEIGQIVGFSPMYNEAVIDRKIYNHTNLSFRKSSGITKISKGEAVLWKMEQYTVTDGM